MEKFVIKDTTNGKYFIEVIPFIGSPFYGKKKEAKTFPTKEAAQNKIFLIDGQKTNVVESIELPR